MTEIFTLKIPVDLASSLLGFVLAFGLYLFDKSIKPDIEIQVSEPSNLSLSQGVFKSLNLKILNKKRYGILQFLNRPATQVRVYLLFSDYSSRALMNTVIARWNNSREPLTPDYQDVDFGLALTHPREVLVPGEENTISVAVRKKDNKYCFPFSNESYIYQNKDFEVPGWKIEDDKFIVVVRMQSAEMDKIGGVFIILNKSTLEQFKIEKVEES
ncbi:MAG: hypothetical protein G01um10145_206 [Microgenomates group bacterium Gr01-1014_5]|nr:MAG: hypothetical protein G01um10145_206 [Microgenomates group bacterium Gr01-1014_5]